MSTRNESGLAPQSVEQTLIQLGPAAAPSAFDAHHPPAIPDLDKCVHCGFCLPACPTYVLWGNEMDSPRGRIWMMRKAALGESTLDATFRTHMDNCLGCMACMTACPSGVEYNKLIEPTRAQIERQSQTKHPHVNPENRSGAPFMTASSSWAGSQEDRAQEDRAHESHAHENTPRPTLPQRSLPDRLFRNLLFATFPHPRRLRFLALPMALYQRSGLQTLLRKSGLLTLLPRRLQAMESLLPPVPLNPFHALPTSIPASSSHMSKGRVALLTGCVQDAFFAHVNAATARVLSAEGYDVVIPPSQPCCGALMVHSGLEPEAIAHAKRLIAAFESADVHTVVINSAGCGSTMKEYGHLLRDDPAWAARASAFSAKCKDISELLAAHPPQSSRSPLPLRVAYHDACHLRHAQGIFAAPRTLLAQIPSLTVAELAEAALCCGSAGVYNLLHPDTADELANRKVQHLLDTRAEALISANPGCLLQLMSALRRHGHAELPTFHMVELLDASIRGLTLDQLLHGRRSLSIAPHDAAPPIMQTKELTPEEHHP
jgi:glycolate oxidase iron-sulfur subunit